MNNKHLLCCKLFSGIAVSVALVTSLFALGILNSPNVFGVKMDNKTGMMTMMDNKTGMMTTMNTQTGMIDNKTDMMMKMDSNTGMPMIDNKKTGEMMNPSTGDMMSK